MTIWRQYGYKEIMLGVILFIFLFIYLFVFDGTLEIDGCTPTLKKSVANFLKFKEK